MKKKTSAYKTLEKVFKKLHDLDQVQSVLSWDSAVMMPDGGAHARAEQTATLASLRHAILTDPGVADLLDQAKSEQGKLSGWQKSNLALMRRLFTHADAVPRKLVRQFSKAGSECEMVWRQARADNDFKALVKPLKKVVELAREVAKAKGDALGCSPYDALLDLYDPGRKSEQLDEVFADLKGFLPDFIGQVVEKQKSDKVTTLKGPFCIEKQKMLSERLLDIVGFDRSKGRLDTSHHPFCGGYPSDIRITTRYDENDFPSSMMAVIHEAGHAAYEAGLPENWQGQPVGLAQGMSIHESQSLLFEMQACRSKEFISFITPVIKEVLGVKGKGWTAANIYSLVTRVQPSLIRVDADEVTYPGHVMLRYYIEKYLIADDMSVDDLPEAWAQGMEKFVGIKPTDDANGCMQDIHWMDGTFGYFPTYTLGGMYAAQLFQAAKESDKSIASGISKGDFAPLRLWLNKQVHDKGSRYSADELIKSATGKPLDAETYKAHLKSRYLD